MKFQTRRRFRLMLIGCLLIHAGNTSAIGTHAFEPTFVNVRRIIAGSREHIGQAIELLTAQRQVAEVIRASLSRLVVAFIGDAYKRRCLVYGLSAVLIATRVFGVLDLPPSLFRLYIFSTALIGIHLCLWRSTAGARRGDARFYTRTLRFGALVFLLILIHLRFADPDEVKKLFAPMVSKSSTILSYAPTNTLIITDNYANIARLMKILKTIDIPGVGREITLLPARNAQAAKLVSLLETVFKTSRATSKKGSASSGASVVFVADTATNSLIITANRDDYTTLVEVIHKIEIPRAMVYIEALIMEVNADESFDLGTEWLVGSDVSSDTIAAGGFTTDNQDASITVGKNVPYQTTTSTTDNDIDF